jgi:membrane-bound lytic murein transglycosylase MltF
MKGDDMYKIMHNVVLFLLFFMLLPSSLLNASEEKENSQHHPLDSHLTKKYIADLPDMIEKKYIRVLTTMNRTNFFLAGAKPCGFEYSLLKEYEKLLNKKNKKLKITLEFIPVSRDRLLPDLIAGYGDIAAAGLTITEKRKKEVDFTLPYIIDIDEFLVTHKKVKALKSLTELSGEKVFVRKSSSYYESLIILNKQLKKEGLQPVTIIEADENLETEDILELVNTGAIKMTVCDSHIAKIWKDALCNIKIHENIKLRKGGQIAWAVRKNNPKLKESLDNFIKEHKKGTLLGNIFFKRYYKKNEWIKNPIIGETEKKIKQYKPIFEKYADKYGFDWQLILAMAFQESELNHNKKSKRGALGLMQIKPSTASDPNVGIKNIHKLENNIHAGVKYLYFIKNRYFSGENIKKRDSIRLSLAAYNAGPAKIRKAQEKAKKMNLDPNRWFRNVELAALYVISEETVKYVSNINKYYVIYKNTFEREEMRKKIKQQIQ